MAARAEYRDDTMVLIPARGGSKGVPRKNIRPLEGKPLIAYTIEAALEADVGPVFVSTDDEDIAEVAHDSGAQVPFMRPSELATDTASSLDVVLHAANTLFPDTSPTTCLLQPTSPFRDAEDIRGAVSLHRQQAKAVVGVHRAEKPPQWLFELDDAGGMQPFLDGDDVTRRQDASALYWPNGSIYVLDTDELRRFQTAIPAGALPWIMPTWKSVDIDTELDWIFAEALASRTPQALRTLTEHRS